MDHPGYNQNNHGMLEEVERQRASARKRARQRRESMTIEERETYLARRRQRYRAQRAMQAN